MVKVTTSIQKIIVPPALRTVFNVISPMVVFYAPQIILLFTTGPASLFASFLVLCVREATHRSVLSVF